MDLDGLLIRTCPGHPGLIGDEPSHDEVGQLRGVGDREQGIDLAGPCGRRAEVANGEGDMDSIQSKENTF